MRIGDTFVSFLYKVRRVSEASTSNSASWKFGVNLANGICEAHVYVIAKKQWALAHTADVKKL